MGKIAPHFLKNLTKLGFPGVCFALLDLFQQEMTHRKNFKGLQH